MLAMFHYSQLGDNLVYVIKKIDVSPPFSFPTLFVKVLCAIPCLDLSILKDGKVPGLQNTSMPFVMKQKK